MDVFEAVRTVLAVRSFEDKPVQPGGQGQKRRKSLAAVAHRERFGLPVA